MDNLERVDGDINPEDKKVLDSTTDDLLTPSSEVGLSAERLADLREALKTLDFLIANPTRSIPPSR